MYPLPYRLVDRISPLVFIVFGHLVDFTQHNCGKTVNGREVRVESVKACKFLEGLGDGSCVYTHACPPRTWEVVCSRPGRYVPFDPCSRIFQETRWDTSARECVFAYWMCREAYRKILHDLHYDDWIVCMMDLPTRPISILWTLEPRKVDFFKPITL